MHSKQKRGKWQKKFTGLKGTDLTSNIYCGYLKDMLIYASINSNLLLFSAKKFTKSKKAHKNVLN